MFLFLFLFLFSPLVRVRVVIVAVVVDITAMVAIDSGVVHVDGVAGIASGGGIVMIVM